MESADWREEGENLTADGAYEEAMDKLRYASVALNCTSPDESLPFADRRFWLQERFHLAAAKLRLMEAQDYPEVLLRPYQADVIEAIHALAPGTRRLDESADN